MRGGKRTCAWALRRGNKCGASIGNLEALSHRADRASGKLLQQRSWGPLGPPCILQGAPILKKGLSFQERFGYVFFGSGCGCSFERPQERVSWTGMMPLPVIEWMALCVTKLEEKMIRHCGIVTPSALSDVETPVTVVCCQVGLDWSMQNCKFENTLACQGSHQNWAEGRVHAAHPWFFSHDPSVQWPAA